MFQNQQRHLYITVTNKVMKSHLQLLPFVWQYQLEIKFRNHIYKVNAYLHLPLHHQGNFQVYILPKGNHRFCFEIRVLCHIVDSLPLLNHTFPLLKTPQQCITAIAVVVLGFNTIASN